MSEDTADIVWEPAVKEKYAQMLAKIPVFLRPVAEKNVGAKAVKIVKADGRLEITEKDMVVAFFEATPFGFHGPMKTDMEKVGVDYKKYGHQ